MEQFQNTTGFMDLMRVVDDKVGERSDLITIGSALLIMIFSISFMATKRMGMDTAFAFASFMTFLSSFFLLYIGFINMGVFVFSSIMVFLSVAYLLYKKREVRG